MYALASDVKVVLTRTRCIVIQSGPVMEHVQNILAQPPTDDHELLQREAAYASLCAGASLSVSPRRRALKKFPAHANALELAVGGFTNTDRTA